MRRVTDSPTPAAIEALNSEPHSRLGHPLQRANLGTCVGMVTPGSHSGPRKRERGAIQPRCPLSVPGDDSPMPAAREALITAPQGRHGKGRRRTRPRRSQPLDQARCPPVSAQATRNTSCVAGWQPSDAGSYRGAVLSASPPVPPGSPSCCDTARPAPREALITAPHSRRGEEPPSAQAARNSCASCESSGERR